MELTFPGVERPVLYSANFGPDEPVRPLTISQSHETILFTDKDVGRVEGWDRIIRVPFEDLAETPRKAARHIKLLPHRWFPEAPWSVWFDATHEPAIDLDDLQRYLTYSEIACFMHPTRTTVKAEVEECKRLGLDDPEKLDAAWKWMTAIRFDDHHGLYGTACVARKNTAKIASLNELWWLACKVWTQRDQVILPWALWTLDIVPACLPGKPRDHGAPKGETHRPNPYFNVTVW